MATFIVSNTDDSGAGSLRQAILDANNPVVNPGADEILFDPSLNGETITLSSGELLITDDLTIDGDLNDDGTPDFTVDANQLSRVFSVDEGDGPPNDTVLINGLVITGGLSDTGSGILNQGFLTFSNGKIIDNQGIGISNLSVSSSSAPASLEIINSSISENTARGISSQGKLTVSNSTVSKNLGGGIFFNATGNPLGSATIRSSTVSENALSTSTSVIQRGGGVFLSGGDGTATISNSTIVSNVAEDDGGGIWTNIDNTIINSSIIADNTTAEGYADLSGARITIGSSLVEDINLSGIRNNLGGNIFNQDPLLDPNGLRNNGGTTETILLLSDSPAIDAGSNPNNLEFDQRGDGFLRVINGQADVGAVEIQTLPPPEVLEFHLIDSVTDTVVAIIEEGDVFQVGTLPNLNNLSIAAKVPDSSPVVSQVESVFINLNSGEATRTENGEPYTLFGDRDGDFFTGSGLPLGDNSISFALFSEDWRQGDLLDTVVLNFSIEDIPAPTNLVVNTARDEFDGSVTDGDVSLRDAIGAIAEGGRITFADSVAGEELILDSFLGELVIDKSLTIDAGSTGTRGFGINANQRFRVLRIDDGNSNSVKNVSLNNITITGGGSAISPTNIGGGILNRESLTLNNSVVSGNSANTRGGGIYNEGYLLVSNSTVSRNSASNYGGGIFNIFGTANVINSTLYENTSNDKGGGIYNRSNMSVLNSTLSGNSATRFGGGIFNIGNAEGISSFTLGNSTLTTNSAREGGGIFNWSFRSGSTASFSNSLITGNAAISGSEIYNKNSGIIVADANNLFGQDLQTDAEAFFDFTPGLNDITATGNGTNPTNLNNILNTTLNNNGGSTLTHALLAGSPAIDAGINSNIPPDIDDLDADDNVTEPTPFDQRGPGFDRVINNRVDIGAFELQTPIISDGLEFQLIDAATDTVIDVIDEGEVFFADMLPPLDDLTIAATVPNDSPLAGQVESAFLSLNSGEATRTENGDPYSLFGDRNGNFFVGSGLSFGDSSISVNLFSEDRRVGDFLGNVTRNFTIVDNLTGLDIGLFDADSDERIATLFDGAEIDASLLEGRSVNIAAFVPQDSPFAGQVESMFLNLNQGEVTRTENSEPYSLFGDVGGDFFGGSIPSGSNTISFDLYSENRRQGDLLDTIAVDFSVV